MLKIGNVIWKGRCGKHPTYDPRDDGEGGIRGGCPRCYALLAISRQHEALMRALREFGASSERKRPTPPPAPERQQSLF